MLVAFVGICKSKEAEFMPIVFTFGISCQKPSTLEIPTMTESDCLIASLWVCSEKMFHNTLSCYRGKTWALVLEVSDEGVVDDGAGGARRGRLEVELGIAVAGEGKKWEVCGFGRWRRSGRGV